MKDKSRKQDGGGIVPLIFGWFITVGTILGLICPTEEFSRLVIIATYLVCGTTFSSHLFFTKYIFTMRQFLFFTLFWAPLMCFPLFVYKKIVTDKRRESIKSILG